MKPCPFCGAPAQQISWYLIRCTRCRASMETYSSRENVEEMWNRRTENSIPSIPSIPSEKEGNAK